MELAQHSIAEEKENLDKFIYQLQEVAAALQTKEDFYKLAEAEYQQASGNYNTITLNITKQQSVITTLEQELNFKQQQVTNLKNQIEESNTQLVTSRQQIEGNKEQLQNAQELLTELLRTKEADEKTLNEADAEYYKLRNVIAEKESELRHLQKNKENADSLLNEIKDNLNNLKLQLAGMKERLDVEFKINLDDVINDPRENEDTIEDMQASVDRMKKRLENLGEVNPTAIEAYTEMKKRYEFILEQKNDLVTAKESLLQTIQEVEATANQQFLETFNAVRENFQKVFKALFTDDDTADMVLENPDNLAETGIDIVAKPKGKRPSSINQLSGGEKTLTATALLFAIYLIKPAPFCILDEVDGLFGQLISKKLERIRHPKTELARERSFYKLQFA